MTNATMTIANKYDKMAEDFLSKHNATVTFELIGKHKPSWGSQPVNTYWFTIERDGKSYSNTFYDSLHNTRNGIEPTAYSLLSGLQKYEVGTYHNFCEEFGISPYDSSSEELYTAVVNEEINVERLFGDCMEELQEIC